MSMKRILVVGVGSIGERHVRCFLGTGRAKVGICEINASLRDQIQSRYEIRDVFCEPNDALSESWDAAVIATPAHTHIPIAMIFANRGINLFIEKPLSVDKVGVNDLSKLVADKHLAAAVAYVYRTNPGLAALRDSIQSGAIGKPLNLIYKCGQNFPFYRPAYLDTYYTDRSRGGGVIQDAATHLFNTAEWLVGPINRVCADASHQAVPGVDVEDTVHVLARHGRVMSVIMMNQFQPVNETLIEVHGDRGSVQLSMHEACWRFADQPGGAWTSTPWEATDRDTPFIAQANSFLDTLTHGIPPLCSLDEGIHTLRVNMAVMRSALHTNAWESV